MVWLALLMAACWHCACAQFLSPYACDSAGVQGQINFNFAQFAGSGPWREVQRVVEGAPLQGACANATVTHDAVAGALRVLYADVWEARRREYSAAGNRSVGDTSGRLALTVDLGGGAAATYPMYVLSTDYDNYALVYICRPVNTTSSQVFLSKLSRTENLTDVASLTISNYLQGSVALSGKVFTGVGRTPQACSAASAAAASAAVALLVAALAAVTPRY